MRNLLDNALKFSGDGKVVDIAVTCDGERVRLRVVDQGVGFDPDQAAGFFKRFRRGKTGVPGSGLGLALARSVARGHAGTLTLTSEGEGRGATAELSLPVLAAPSEGR